MAGVTVRTSAELVSANKTQPLIAFHRLRLLIDQNSPHLAMFKGEIEADERLWWIPKGKRSNGAAGKVAVFEILKRNGKVYTVSVPNTQTAL